MRNIEVGELEQDTVDTSRPPKKPFSIVIVLGLLAVLGYLAYRTAAHIPVAPRETGQSDKAGTFSDVQAELERRTDEDTPSRQDMPEQAPPGIEQNVREQAPPDIEWMRDGPPEPSHMDLAEGHRPKIAADPAGPDLLRDAIRRGNDKFLRKILERSELSGLANGDGRHLPPIFDAVMADNPAVLRVLIDAGADIDGSWLIGQIEVHTPLSYAVWHGKHNALFALLDAGVDATRLVCPPEGPCGNALSLAALKGDAALLTRMINHEAIDDAVINMRGIDEYHTRAVWGGPYRQLLPALHMAARAGQREAVETLLVLGADMDRLDVGKRLADDHAGIVRAKPIEEIFATRRAAAAALVDAIVRGDKAQVVAMLDSGVSPDIAPRRGPSPLVVAISHRNRELVRILLEAGANPAKYHNESTPLHAAMLAPDIAIVRLLLGAGADPNRYIDGKMPPLAAAVRTDDLELVRTFLDAGASLTAHYKTREYGIHNILSYAILHNAMEPAILLARSGADPNLFVCSAERICGNALTLAAVTADTSLVQRLVTEGRLTPEAVNMTRLVRPEIGLGAVIIRFADREIALTPQASQEVRLPDGARLRDRQQLLSPMRAARMAGREDVVDVLYKLGAQADGPGEIVIVE